MNRLHQHRFVAFVALSGIAIGSGIAISAYGAAAPSTQPRAVISNPTTTTAITPPGLLPSAAAPAVANGPPTPRIIVIDRNYILQRSSAGQDMVNQVQNLTKAAETEFKTQETQLATEAQQLQQKVAIMAADAREKAEKEFTEKQQAFQGRVAQRQAEIQAGFNKAAHQLEVALEPILKQIMTERGANLVFDRSAVILSTVDIDVTPVAVQRLDKALPHVKVELTPVPATPGAAPPALAAAPKPAAPAIVPAAAPKK
jgi:outer membrane protein